MFQFALLHKQLVQMQQAAAVASVQSPSPSTVPAPPPPSSPLTIASSTLTVPQLPPAEKATASSKLPPQLLNLTPQPPSAHINPATLPPGNIVSSNDSLMASASLPVAPPPISGETTSLAHNTQAKCKETFAIFERNLTS